jgi:hypothetical protein
MAAGEFDLRKFAGAAVAIALNVAIVAALLQTTIGRTPPEQPPNESIIWLSLPPKPRPHVTPAAPRRPQRPAIELLRIIPGTRAITLPPAADLKGLHDFLFVCTAQNLADLPPEQRAQCKGVLGPRPDDDTVDFADHTSRSRDAARWARERDRKNGPLLLPCASPNAAGIGIGTLLCLGNGLVNGFDLDAQPGYADKPVEIHVPNNGDPPDAPH